MHDLVISFPEDLQRVILNRVAGSYAVWVEDFILFVDYVTFEEEQAEADITFIQLCASLGWVSEAVLIPVREEYLRFYGGYATYYRKSYLHTVGTIIRALGNLPYSFDEEYLRVIESLRTQEAPPPSPLPSYNLPPPPNYWPYTTLFYKSWDPKPDYNQFSDSIQNQHWAQDSWGSGTLDWDDWGNANEEDAPTTSWGDPI